LITAPCKDDSVQTIVMGVNHKEYDLKKFQIVSNASCTTNAVAPTVMVLDREFGIESAMMSTLHTFTHSQNLLDNSNPRDFRRARATNESIIPTSTGATIAVSKVLPALEGRITGMSFRVPIISVSLIDLTVCFKKKVTVDEINEAFLKAESEDLMGILGTSDEPLVSVDYRGDTRSAIVDLLSTKVINGNMAQIVVWYDNEWGYTSRVLDQIRWTMSHGG
ncbi:MAG: type I glyceraldehyde-3-phosphate dehydrogenase, partial [Candidatus Peregrinibacteria bacterium]|nr:type I glyceraldehyde-3-phosphate dehydrogenase [Candidatus Peregrinibacteria bacterium]